MAIAARPSASPCSTPIRERSCRLNTCPAGKMGGARPLQGSSRCISEISAALQFAGVISFWVAGAFLFYTGNLLWIETRRKKSRKGAEVTQSRSSHVLGALTVGVSLGCIAGISLTVAAAKMLPGLVENPAAWHSGIYYTAFVAAVGWAFFRGAARGSVELLIFSAVATALIPVVSIASLVIPGFGWNHGGAGSIVDLTAALGAGALLFLAHKTALRIKSAPIDSIWYAAGASIEAPQVAPGVTAESVHG
ncbi:MAG: hypothetical protein R3C54_14115 [Parvularculaceae bacterium]